MQGGSFTITNLGPIGSTASRRSSTLPKQPSSASAASRRKPVVVDGKVEARTSVHAVAQLRPPDGGRRAGGSLPGAAGRAARAALHAARHLASSRGCGVTRGRARPAPASCRRTCCRRWCWVGSACADPRRWSTPPWHGCGSGRHRCRWACVLTTDPITTATAGAGGLAVNVVCNDLAAMGAEPVGVLADVALPGRRRPGGDRRAGRTRSTRPPAS